MTSRPNIDSLDEWLAHVSPQQPAPRWPLRLVVVLGAGLAFWIAALTVATVVAR